MLYVCNVSEDDAVSGNSLTDKVAQKAAAEGADMVIVSAAIESEIISLDADEKKEFLDDLGLEEAGLARMINAGYRLLNLITFLPLALKKLVHGHSGMGAKHLKPLASFIPIFSVDLFVRKPLPMMIIFPIRAKLAQKMLANFVSKGLIIWSRMVMFFTSALMSDQIISE